MSDSSKFDITTAKWGEVKQIEKYDLAILPWGATEPHNYHLPYCTDMLASAAPTTRTASWTDWSKVKPEGSLNLLGRLRVIFLR